MKSTRSGGGSNSSTKCGQIWRRRTKGPDRVVSGLNTPPVRLLRTTTDLIHTSSWSNIVDFHGEAQDQGRRTAQMAISRPMQARKSAAELPTHGQQAAKIGLSHDHDSAHRSATAHFRDIMRESIYMFNGSLKVTCLFRIKRMQYAITENLLAVQCNAMQFHSMQRQAIPRSHQTPKPLPLTIQLITPSQTFHSSPSPSPYLPYPCL
jgi:hypothetical protein